MNDLPRFLDIYETGAPSIIRGAWLPSHDRRLAELWRDGVADEEIAPLLGRSIRAVGARRLILGLTLPRESKKSSPHYQRSHDMGDGLRERIEERDRVNACDTHLEDLRRWHNAGIGELSIPSTGYSLRHYSPAISQSCISSPANLCADIA